MLVAFGTLATVAMVGVVLGTAGSRHTATEPVQAPLTVFSPRATVQPSATGTRPADAGSLRPATTPAATSTSGVAHAAPTSSATATPAGQPAPAPSSTRRTSVVVGTAPVVRTTPTVAAPSITPSPTSPPTVRDNGRAPTTVRGAGQKSAYYPNCDAVRAAGAAPLLRSEPGYRKALDPDGDGIACDAN